MEWIDALRGATVGLDTAPLIYFIERHPTYVEKPRPFFAATERCEFQLATSFVTLLEVLVRPLRTGRDDLAGGGGSPAGRGRRRGRCVSW